MKKQYNLPNFNDLNSYWIDQSIKKMEKSHLYKNDFEAKPDIDKYIKVVQKLREKEKLYKREYKVLIYYLDKLEKEKLFPVFFERFVKDMNSFMGYGTFVRPFHNYIYNSYDKSENMITIYKLMKFMKRGFPDKRKYEQITKKITENESLNSFFRNINEEMKNLKDEKEVEDYCKSVFLKTTDRFFYECMKEFIVMNYLNDDLGSLFESVMGNMELHNKKYIFRKILLKYKDNYNVEGYHDKWFELIHRELKEPYDPSNKRWHGMEEEVKEIFRRWNVDKRISDFFENIVGGDKRRLEFWKQYANNVYRIEHFKNVNDALVMEFKNHTFVEFAEHGNALYVYNKEHIDLEIVKSRIQNSGLSKTAKIKMLKDPDIVLQKMIHRGNWEYDFNHTIKQFGYEKSRW